MTTTIPENYPYPDYEAAHHSTYERVPRHPIKPVLPPGITEAVFALAIQEFIAVLGQDAVFTNEALSDYIDPYDVNEADPTKRKVPSAAVWSATSPTTPQFPFPALHPTPYTALM